MKKKIFALTSVIILLMTAFFSSCGGENGDDVSYEATPTPITLTSEDITLKIAQSSESKLSAQLLRQIADKYEANHENVTIEIADAKSVGAQDADIIEVNDENYVQYIKDGSLYDMYKNFELWDEHLTVSYATLHLMSTFTDEIYFVPYAVRQTCFFVRDDLQGDETLITWQDAYNLGKKLMQQGKVDYGIAIGTNKLYEFADTIILGELGSSAVVGTNTAYFCEDKKKNVSTIFTLPETKKALQLLKSLYTDISPTGSFDWSYDDAAQSFASGEAAMMVSDSSAFKPCEESLSDSQWKLMPPLPGDSNQSPSYASFFGFGVSSESENKNEAADFIFFLTNSDNNTYCAKQCEFIPVQSAASTLDEYFIQSGFSVFIDMSAKPEINYFIMAPKRYDAFEEYDKEADGKYRQYLEGEISVDELTDYLDSFWMQAYENEGKLW